MASARQLAANRANAKKSTGPRTEAGKHISRLNAVQHGLTGLTILRTPEQDAAYATYRARLYPDLAPDGAIESDLAERVVYDSWRVHRASTIEANLYALAEAAFDTGNPEHDDALNEAHAFQVHEKSINLLSLYQQRLQRGIHKDLAMLRQIQKERKAKQPTAAQSITDAAKPALTSTKPALQIVQKPDLSPAIGSVSSTPPANHPPPPSTASAEPENMAA